ncbi:MAG TPA: hypothetical protein PKN33_17205 [Phycisphaerae bacterium]|nr:hypothetical protein [Phycisphaerae bacterium]
MVRFEIQLDQASPGWATILLRTDERTLTIPCSSVGGDCLDEIVRAFISLAEGDHRASATVGCYGEPECTVLRLKRRGEILEISATCFSWEGDRAQTAKVQRALNSMKPKDWAKMIDSRNKSAKLRQSAALDETIASLIQAFQAIEKQHGANGYKSIWGFEFPSAELATLGQDRSPSVD